MKTMEEIKNDLDSIKFYYSKKDAFDNSVLVRNSVIELVEEYNGLMKNIPPRLYDIYIGLYMNGNTQEAYALDEGYSIGYVNKMNMQLLDYLLKKFNE